MFRFYILFSIHVISTWTYTTQCEKVDLVQGQQVWSGSVSDTTQTYLGQYTFYESTVKNNKLIIFLGSFPGISSQLYNLRGVGPQLLQDDMELILNPNDYSKFSNLLFLDVLGSGYSQFNDQKLNLNSLAQITSQMLQVILHSQCVHVDQKSLYLTSQFYGSKVLLNMIQYIKVKGILLFSPLFNAEQMLRNVGELAYNFGLIDMQERQRVETSVLGALINGITQQKFNELINKVSKMSGNMNSKNFFTYQINHDQLSVSHYLNLESSRIKFKVASDKFFHSYNLQVAQQFEQIFPLDDCKQLLSDIISKGETKIHIILNTQSLSTNYVGNMQWLNGLNWHTGKEEKSLKGVSANPIIIGNNQIVGTQRVIDTLTITTVFNSGENIWQDQAANLFQIVQNYIQ